MNKKTLKIFAVLFLLFFVSGVVVLSAQSRSELSEAYDAGFNRGYRDCRSKDDRLNSGNALAAALREYPIKVPDTEQGRLRSKFAEGYIDGWNDKKATFN